MLNCSEDEEARSGTNSRNGPKGASHYWYLTPFPAADPFSSSLFYWLVPSPCRTNSNPDNKGNPVLGTSWICSSSPIITSEIDSEA